MWRKKFLLFKCRSLHNALTIIVPLTLTLMWWNSIVSITEVPCNDPPTGYEPATTDQGESETTEEATTVSTKSPQELERDIRYDSVKLCKLRQLC